MCLRRESIFGMLKYNKTRSKSMFKNKIIAFPIIFVTAFFFIVTSDMGILKWNQLKNKRNQIQKEINQLIIKEAELNLELDKLLNDTEYIKKIAKEKFHMIRKGEKVFRVKERQK